MCIIYSLRLSHFSQSFVTNMKFFQALGTCVLALSSLVSATTFTNPLKQTDGSDPHIAYSGGYYYLMTTTWSDLRITRAKTLGGLKTGETKTVWTDSNANRCCNMWAVSFKRLFVRSRCQLTITIA